MLACSDLPRAHRAVAPAGGGLHDSHVVKGMVLKRGVEGSISSVTDAKVAVFAQGVDTASTETKVRWERCPGRSRCASRRSGQLEGACAADVAWFRASHAGSPRRARC